MKDELGELEERLARHRPAMPGPGLRRRIMALPGRGGSGIWWQGLAAGLLGMAALVQIITSARPVMPAAPRRDGQEAIAAIFRQLDLPLTDAECRLFAVELAAGAQLKPLPPMPNRAALDIRMGGN